MAARRRSAAATRAELMRRIDKLSPADRELLKRIAAHVAKKSPHRRRPR